MKLSTKILAVAFVLAIALVAVSASAANFTSNLTVGSTGAEVTALQTALGVTPATGYFGAITKAAVKKFQADHGISATGFVGPLTRAALNGAAPVAGDLCPNGMTLASNCTVAPGTTAPVALCPNGNTIASNCATAPSGTVTPVANGTDGTLTAAVSSYVSSGIQLKKGDTKDIAAINLKASVGPVTITRAAVHFNTRPWLVLSQVTLHDSTGKVLATKTLSSAADATEITVGSDYLVQFPNINYTVTPGANVDLVVGATVLAATDKIPTNGLTLNTAFDTLRTINGVGWTDSVSGASLGTVGAGANSVTLTSTGSVADIYARISPNSPATRQVATSLTQTTSNVVVGVFSLKSANNASTLNTLNVTLTGQLSSSASTSNVRLFDGANSYGGTVSSGVATFSNLNIPLAQDAWHDFTIQADIAPAVAGTATVSLTANTTNIVATDSNYNTATVEAGTATSNVVTFTTNAVTVTSAASTLGSAIIQGNNTVGYNVNYTFTITNTSNNDLFVSATSTTLATQAVTGGTLPAASSTLSSIQTVSPSSYNGDVAGVAYVIPAGLSRTFTLIGAIRGTTGTTVNLKVTSINYGTAAADASNHASNVNFGLENLSQTASF